MSIPSEAMMSRSMASVSAPLPPVAARSRLNKQRSSADWSSARCASLPAVSPLPSTSARASLYAAMASLKAMVLSSSQA